MRSDSRKSIQYIIDPNHETALQTPSPPTPTESNSSAPLPSTTIAPRGQEGRYQHKDDGTELCRVCLTSKDRFDWIMCGCWIHLGCVDIIVQKKDFDNVVKRISFYCKDHHL